MTTAPTTIAPTAIARRRVITSPSQMWPKIAATTIEVSRVATTYAVGASWNA